MAVLSRPSLRSSAYRDADQALPATEKPRQSSESRKGKRARHPSQGHESDTSSKKFKSNSHTGTQRISRLERDDLQSLPFRARQPVSKEVVTHDVKSRKLDPVLVQPKNGLILRPTSPDSQLHNGINQNLPPPSIDQVEKRSLRSHDGGSRSKSELAQYFSNYDELISIEPREPDIIGPETMLFITDDASATGPAQKVDSRKDSFQHCMQWPEEVFTTFTNATRIELPSLHHRAKQRNKDPLDDSVYLKAHAREERKEKQLRNIEKERAMHEKSQLERLLDGLRGHDWLRVMGISGITDGEKKSYEPKRDHLITEVRALLEKFRLWKEEEKRRKAEKEEDMEAETDEDEESKIAESENEASSSNDSETISDGDPPDYTDVDASAARQLRMEAIRANDHRRPKKPSKDKNIRPGPKSFWKEPFKSFYAKPYLRAAAIEKHRRSGRSRMAFGQPLPDVQERTFDLPADFKTAEAMMESGRRMRLSKREVKGPDDDCI